MKTFFRTVFGESCFARALRMTVVAAVMVYVMFMVFTLPTMNAYAEASKQRNEASETASDRALSEPLDEYANDSNEVDALSDERTYQEADRYSNSWNNECDSDANVLFEDEAKRTETDKHFRMSDGSYLLVSSSTNVHYAVNGKYEEIDNTLEKQGAVYKNKANILKVELPETFSVGKKTKVSVGEYSLYFSLKGYTSSKSKSTDIENIATKQSLETKSGFEFSLNNQSKAVYGLTEANIQLEQVIIGTQFKENIVVNAPMTSYSFSFDLQADGLVLELNDNGDIYGFSESGELILTIPKGYMFDAAGDYSEAVDYKLEEIKAGYILTVTADNNWINKKGRVFPVTIDPSVNVASGDFRSATRGTLSNNRLPVKQSTKSFLEFTLPTALANTTVISAYLKIGAQVNTADKDALLNVWSNTTALKTDATIGQYVAPEIKYYDAPNPYNISSTIRAYTLYFDDHSKNYMPEQQLMIRNNVLNDYYIDITRNVKAAVDFNSSATFCGFAFSAKDDTETIYIANQSHATPDKRPTVQIRYRSIVGLESYWDYDSYSVGSDSVYINKYNDAMTVVRDIAAVAADLPITLQLVWMSAYRNAPFNVDGIYNNLSFGFGWKLNYQQIIRCRGNDFEYYDADGTMHYFYKDNALSTSFGHNVAKDEDGLGLILHNLGGGTYKMTTQSKDALWFDTHGRLYKIEDSNGNVTNIKNGNGDQSDTAGLLITEINDNEGRAITFTYNGNKLTSINYKRADGQTNASTAIAYNGNLISRITNDDGTFTDYVYDSNNNITQLTDESGYSMQYRSNSTWAMSRGIDIPVSEITIPWAKTRSVWESSGNSGWLHVSDNIYCDGLTMSVTAAVGENYIPFASQSDLTAIQQDLFSRAGTALIILLTLSGVGLIVFVIVCVLESIAPYKEMAMPYYSNNFRVKNVYDDMGRLVSSYIDDVNSLTAVDTRYEQPSSNPANGVNVNSNKPNATVSYTPGVVNYVNNGSFENGTTGWTIPSSTSPYRSRIASDKYATEGQNSLEVFTAQPQGGTVYVAYQSLFLPAGTYTLSAKIRVENLLVPASVTTNYGAYIRFMNHVDSEYVNADLYSNNDGFKYVYVTYTFDQPTGVDVDICMANCAGFVYFDEIQVVRNDYGVVDSGNFAVNAGFERWTSTLPNDWLHWNASVTKITNESRFSGTNSLILNGNINADTGIRQVVPITPSSQSRAFTVGAWINTFGRVYLPKSNSAIAMGFRALDANGNAIYGYTSGLDGNGYYDTPIRSSFAVWQQISATFVVPANTRSIEITFTLKYTTSKLLVDNVSIAESHIINYGYNSFGENSYYSDGQKIYTYTDNGDNNPAGIEIGGAIKYGIIKDSRGNVIKATEAQRGSTMQYTYDSAGRITSQTFSGTGSKKIYSQTSYSLIQDNLLESVTDTDSLGFKTISNYHAYSDALEKTTFNDGSYIDYEYAGNSSINLFNIDKLYSTTGTASYTKLSSTSFKISSTTTTSGSTPYVTFRFTLKRNTFYTLTVTHNYIVPRTAGSTALIRYYDDNWGNVTNITSFGHTNGTQSITFNTGEHKNFVVLFYSGGDHLGTAGECVFSNVQLECGTAATAYSTYGIPAQVKTITIYNRTANDEILSTCVYQYLTVSDALTHADYGRRHVGMLKSVTMPNGTIYSYVYDSWGNVITVRLNGQDQIIYEYRQSDGALIRKTIGGANGYTEYYKYNKLGRLVEMRAVTSPNAGIWGLADSSLKAHVYYEYSVGGQTLKVRDTIDDKGYWYDYDLNGRLILNGEGSYTAVGGSEIIDTKTIFETVYDSYGDVYNTNIIDLTGAKSTYGIPVTSASFSGALTRVDTPAIETIKIGGTEKIKYTHNYSGTALREDNVFFNKSISYTRNPYGKITSLTVGDYTTGTISGTAYTPFYTIKSSRYDYDTGTVNGWDRNWAMANRVRDNVSFKEDEILSDGTVITDILRFYQNSFYSGDYYSLVDPVLLSNTTEQITLSYWICKEKEGESIRRLGFKYSDGTTNYGVNANVPGSDLADNKSWQYFSAQSTPGKTVVAIYLGYNYNSFVCVGNVQVSVAPNAWDNEWLLNNQHVRNANYQPAVPVANDIANGVYNIVKIHPADFYLGTTGVYSLVNPDLLRQGGDCMELSYTVRRINPKEASTVNALRFRYSDGTSSSTPKLAFTEEWQSFSITSAVGKTVVCIELVWNNGEYLHLGNVYLKTQYMGRADGRISGERLFNGNYVEYNYDSLGRLESSAMTSKKASETNYLTESYTYLDSKNLLPESAWGKNANVEYEYADNVLSVTGLNENKAQIYKDIVLTPGEQYTISYENLVANAAGYVMLFPYATGTSAIISKALNTTGKKAYTFTAPEGYKGVRMYVRAYEAGKAPVGTQAVIANIQIEQGAVATGYIPYGNGSYTVSGVNITRGGADIVSYNYAYNMDNALLGTNRLERANPYDIYQIKEGTTLKAEYHYDELGRLKRENDGYNNKTVIYTYDTNNNITSKNTRTPVVWGNDTLTGGSTIGYTYGNATFKDRLTSYNGQAIIYDNGAANGLGLPTTYLGKTLSWTGRELSTLTNGSTTYTYKYDDGGMRLSKTTGSAVTNYLYSGGKLLRESNGTDTIWYIYDQDGMVGFELNGVTYYYVRNLQGDVTKIINTSGTVYATYTYDAWGKCVIGTNKSNIGTLNPIRYRGYYYDTESGFYYLNSRYYDPETGRFISPDVVAEGGNLYAYCQNDPINRADPSGFLSTKWKIAIGIGVIAALAIVTVATAGTGTAVAAIAAGALKGAIVGATIGAASGAALGAGVEAVRHRIETGSWDGAGDAALRGAIGGAADGFMMGAIGGAITGGLNGYANYSSTNSLKGLTPNQKGTMGEKYISNTRGMPKNNKIYGDGLKPDFIDNKVLIESKNVSYQGYTSQLRKYQKYASQTGRTMELYVRQGTTLSSQLKASGIIIRFFPW